MIPADKTQSNQCIGISRGGRSAKIHALVDALGNPLEVMLTTGNVNDVAVAEELLSRIDINGSNILGDKAFGKRKLREYIIAHGVNYCIPPKKNELNAWFVDWWLYKERHLVENFFLKLKEFRHVATRYDKLASRFLAFVHLDCIHILVA